MQALGADGFEREQQVEVGRRVFRFAFGHAVEEDGACVLVADAEAGVELGAYVGGRVDARIHALESRLERPRRHQPPVDVEDLDERSPLEVHSPVSAGVLDA